MRSGVERVFLGWSRPVFDSVADLLWQRYADAAVWDLSRVVVVVPGGLAGRRLGEALATRSEEASVAYFPPDMATVGQLPERLYVCRRPFATTLVQQLVWSDVLRHADPRDLSAFMHDTVTSSRDSDRCELGTLLWRQHRELAADGLDFANVADLGANMNGFSAAERTRWAAMAKVQKAYLRRLDELGLWDRQTARLIAIQNNECQTDSDLWLLGTVDLNRAQRLMIDQVRQRITALVYADASWHESFDEYGCLRAECWQDIEFELRDDQIRIVDGPIEQASEVVRFLSELNGRYTSREISIGVPDESLVPLLERELRQAGVPVRFGPGRSIEASRPVRLLRGLVQYVASRRFADLIDVLRHPDLSECLRARTVDSVADIARLDEYGRQRMIVSVDQESVGRDEASHGARRVIQQVAELLAPLEGPDCAPGEWIAKFLEVLNTIYGSFHLDPDHPRDRGVLGGCEAIRDGLLELRRLPSDLRRPVSASEALLMAIGSMPERRIPAAPNPEAVELMGWLELPLDDAPVLVVTQANEGTIPTSANSDLFLPNALRTYLGIDDNARRYARDAYAFKVLEQTRERLAVIVGRRDAQGNPMLPSRLLLAANDADRIHRCLRFFGNASPNTEHGGSLDPPHPADETAPTATHRFTVPRPTDSIDIATLNVTDFRAYLECPYRFYLRRVLRLASVEHDAAELDGAAFGTLLHDVMEQFGATDPRDSADADEICKQLWSSLHDICLQRYGRQPRPAVLIQQAQLRLRLESFARQQAAWRDRGWKIEMTESECRSVTTRWQVDDRPILLKGRIDRIDRHETTGEVVILDYKSSDDGKPPRKVHNIPTGGAPAGPEDWRDLQLPLYRHLAKELGIEGPVQLGYVNMPRELDAVAFNLADWTEPELAAADEAACRVVRGIRAGRFWEPAEPEVSFDPGLDRICQVHVFDRRLAGSVRAGEGREP